MGKMGRVRETGNAMEHRGERRQDGGGDRQTEREFKGHIDERGGEGERKERRKVHKGKQ